MLASNPFFKNLRPLCILLRQCQLNCCEIAIPLRELPSLNELHAPLYKGDLQKAFFGATRWASRKIEVEVQSMGESITEGTIAEVLKEVGQSVAEDETIAQIETDKVTIDVKSPTAGKIVDVKVKSEDNVKVGQVIAIISEGQDCAEAGGEESPGTSTESPNNAKSDKETAGQGKSAGAFPTDSDAKGRKSTDSIVFSEEKAHTSRIRFPQRMREGGVRISDLPAEEQKRFDETLKARSQPKADSQKPAQPRTRAPWYAGKEQGTKLSQSQVLSQRQMEQIELGGADP